VIEDALVVGELEGPEAEGLGKLDGDRTGVLGLGRDRGVRAVQLLRSSRAREGLQGVEAEAAAVRVERGQRGGAADVPDPGAGRDAARDLGDRSVGHADQHELRGVLAQPHAPLAQAGGNRRADASSADDPYRFDQPSSSSVADTGHG
jgi:hypothetical protein